MQAIFKFLNGLLILKSQFFIISNNFWQFWQFNLCKDSGKKCVYLNCKSCVQNNNNIIKCWRYNFSQPQIWVKFSDKWMQLMYQFFYGTLC